MNWERPFLSFHLCMLKSLKSRDAAILITVSERVPFIFLLAFAQTLHNHRKERSSICGRGRAIDCSKLKVNFKCIQHFFLQNEKKLCRLQWFFHSLSHNSIMLESAVYPSLLVWIGAPFSFPMRAWQRWYFLQIELEYTTVKLLWYLYSLVCFALPFPWLSSHAEKFLVRFFIFPSICEHRQNTSVECFLYHHRNQSTGCWFSTLFVVFFICFFSLLLRWAPSERTTSSIFHRESTFFQFPQRSQPISI